MSTMPAFSIVDSTLVDTVSLDQFRARVGDPLAAWIKVDNQVVAQILAPQARRTWHEGMEQQFRNAVRTLAATYPYEPAQMLGQVSVLFDPPDTGADDGTSDPGELIERVAG